MKTRQVCSFLVVTLLLATANPLTVYAQGERSTADRRKAAPTATTFDKATLVILTPAGPVFAELRISVAKIPYRTWVSRFLAQQMDIDKNGILSETELNLLTENVRKLASISGDVPTAMKAAVAESSTSTTAAPVTSGVAVGMNEVSTRQFAEWLHDRLPRAFDLIAQPQPADDAVRLSSMIDANDDGAIDIDELQATFKILRFRDLDDDQTLSVSELVPFRDPRSLESALTPDAANLPFFHVTDSETADIAVERIIRRFGADDSVPRKTLRMASIASQASEADAMVSKSDLKSLLLSPEYHLTIDVKLSDRANVSDIDVAVSQAANEWCQVTDDAFGQTSIKLDGLPIRITARGGTANTRRVTRGYLGQTFVMVDADRSQWLDETEFSGIQAALVQSGANGEFAVVDLNKDKMITRDELFSFVERDQIATSSRIEVSVKQDGKSLFGLIDVNLDRRLTMREVRSGQQVLTKYDINQDGRFAEGELGTEYSLTFGLGQPDIRRTSGMSMMNPMQSSTDAVLPGREGLSGPEWFRRMDRNQDGDVSRREFPGTNEHFLKIDTNQDGFIEAFEAEALIAAGSGE